MVVIDHYRLALRDYSSGGAAHNNMPPYYVVHIWHRVSYVLVIVLQPISNA